jgi:hypothetical protein
LFEVSLWLKVASKGLGTAKQHVAGEAGPRKLSMKKADQ